MGHKANIVVAGAGAVGSTVALLLARAGYRVHVLDPAVSDNASGVAAGMLAPAFETLFDEAVSERFDLLKLARDGWPELAQSIGLELDRRGALGIGAPTQVETWAQRMVAFGAGVEMLDAKTLGRRSPGHRAGAVGVFTPDDWRIEPPKALAALRQAGLVAGVSYQARRLGVGEATSGEVLVCATGADRGLVAMAPELEVLAPIKGHILRSNPAVGASPVVRGEGVYLCRGPGELVLGASMEVGRDDRGIDRAVVGDLIARAERLWPGAANLAWRAQTGVRAATPDGLPLVGWSVRPNVILAVGARRNGWLLAPLIAETVLGLVEGRPRSQAAALFDPARANAARPDPAVSRPG
jgi:glycine oxidase